MGRDCRPQVERVTSVKCYRGRAYYERLQEKPGCDKWHKVGHETSGEDEASNGISRKAVHLEIERPNIQSCGRTKRNE
jgi:hypothetical protein